MKSHDRPAVLAGSRCLRTLCLTTSCLLNPMDRTLRVPWSRGLRATLHGLFALQPSITSCCPPPLKWLKWLSAVGSHRNLVGCSISIDAWGALQGQRRWRWRVNSVVACERLGKKGTENTIGIPQLVSNLYPERRDMGQRVVIFLRVIWLRFAKCSVV